MNKIFVFFLCTGIFIEYGFAMNNEAFPDQQKKIVSKGFKPQSPSDVNKPKLIKKTDEELIRYDPEREMYYYGMNLSEAAAKHHVPNPPPKITNDDIIVTLNEDKQ